MKQKINYDTEQNCLIPYNIKGRLQFLINNKNIILFTFLKLKIMEKEEYDIDKRVKELHGKLGKITQDKTTTSVGLTEEQIGIVGSSEGRLRKIVKKALYDFEIEAKGQSGKHAEEYVIDEAEKRNLKLTNISASRPICIECQELIEGKEIKTNTSFSGKKSKKRK